MIRIRMFIAAAVFLLFCGLPLSSAPETEIHRATGTIDAVTLFSDRALVVRRLDLRLTGPRAIIRFTDLPAAFSAEAMRARAEGFEISSLAVRSVPARIDAQDPLLQKIESIAKEIRIETDRQANYGEQVKILGSLARLTGERSERDLREGNIQLKAWTEAMQFIEERRASYQEKTRASEEHIVRLKQQLKAATEEQAREINSRRRAPVEVEVVCEGRAGESGTVWLSYMVGGVSWNGVYDLHGSSEGTDFRLESHATIRQNTGEDWTGVKITLSTARPSLAIAPPTLKPWRLRPGAPGVQAETRLNQESTRPGQDVDATPSETSAESADSTAMLTVDLPDRLTIASGGADHRVTIQTATLKGKLLHVAVPGRSQQVFLRASLRNTTGRAILWNSVNIYLDGGFVGTAPLGSVAANGEEFELYLGPDQRMHVRRSLLRGEIISSGLLTKTVEIENRWQVEVANFTKKQQTVMIYEQYPVSGDPGITTKFLGSSLGDTKADANGLLSWTIELRPGETRSFDFGYSMQISQQIWEAIQQQDNQVREPANANPASPVQKQENKKYDLERMFMK